MDKADGRTEKRLSRDEQTAGVHDKGPNPRMPLLEDTSTGGHVCRTFLSGGLGIFFSTNGSLEE